MPTQQLQTAQPFSITPGTAAGLKNSVIKALGRPLGMVLGLDELNARYAKVHFPGEDAASGAFLSRALDELGVRHEISGADLGRIPLTGPLVVASNHPFGVLEGLVLARLLGQLRPDVKILANHLLARIPEMRPHLIVVDPFGGGGSKVRNLSGLREALSWLKNGGALLAFPAGEVASLQVARRMVADPPWQRGVAALARKAGAPVLPVFVHGRNGALFQAAGLVHPRLRTLLIPRENMRTGRTVQVSVGTAVSAERLASFASDEDMSAYLRFRCHLLRRCDETPAAAPKLWRKRAPKPAKALAAQRPRDARLAEIANLPQERILARSAPFLVFEAGAWEIPEILHEVARLRESTFRQVGEGTGEPLDTDRFDAHYRHLVLWNEVDQEVAGAYRFAPTDQVLAAHGPAGMYLSTQFKLRPEFWDQVGHGLELGRSFVRPKYQKAYQPLLLLWRGLAEYVARNPHNRTLFGCVSISGDYSQLARELMMTFLRRHNLDAGLARLVRPTKSPKVRRLGRLDVSVPEAAFAHPGDLGDLVAELEQGRGIPVLLRQYLKLGGRIASFNVDPEFGNCLDGLIVVDLTRTEERVLGRFMGAEQARRYLSCYRGGQVSARADKASAQGAEAGSPKAA